LTAIAHHREQTATGDDEQLAKPNPLNMNFHLAQMTVTAGEILIYVLELLAPPR
jgi:hypothetical protein